MIEPQKPKNYWSQEEAEALVKVWVADDIQGRLLYKYRNMDVYTDVCKRLAKEGYDRYIDYIVLLRSFSDFWLIFTTGRKQINVTSVNLFNSFCIIKKNIL